MIKLESCKVTCAKAKPKVITAGIWKKGKYLQEPKRSQSTNNQSALSTAKRGQLSDDFF